MDGAAEGRDAKDQPLDEDGLRGRLEESRRTMRSLQQDTARVSDAIAETERAVAATLRKLAEVDRERGRPAAADRRESRAEDAERFAARESAEGNSTEEATPDDDRA